MAEYTVRTAEQQDVLNTELETRVNESQFAQHGLVSDDGVNEIRPQDTFKEVDVPDTLVDKKGYPVRFTDGVYDRLGEEQIFNYDNLIEVLPDRGTLTISNKSITCDFHTNYHGFKLPITGDFILLSFSLDNYITPVRVWLSETDYVSITSGGEHSIFVKAMSDDTIQFQDAGYASSSFTITNISVKELPQFALPKAPFATGSTDELLDDTDTTGSNSPLPNGLTTQSNHSKGDIVVVGNELVENGTFETGISGWTPRGDAQLDYENESLKITVEGNDYVGASTATAFPVVNGSMYSITYTIAGNNVVQANAYHSNEPSTQGSTGYTPVHVYGTQDGSYVVDILAEDDYMWLSFYNASVDVIFYIDNISVKLKDQSYIATEDTTAGDLLSYPEWVSGQAKSVNDMVQNDSKVYKCIQTVVGDEDPAIAITDTAYWTYQFDSKFKTIPYVTKQVALLIEKTSAGAILNTVKPLTPLDEDGNSTLYGEESVETYEADIFSELGYSQKADRVWTDGSSEFILVGVKGYIA